MEYGIALLGLQNEDKVCPYAGQGQMKRQP
jgi:hypothetical protein